MQMLELSRKLIFCVSKLVVSVVSVFFSEKYPNFFQRSCPGVTVLVSSLNFEAMILASVFSSFSTRSFVREKTLAFLIAVDTDESIAGGTFSKGK